MGGGRANVGCDDLYDIIDSIHQETHHLAFELDDDISRARLKCDGLEAEPTPKVDDGDDISAQIDDPADVIRSLVHRRQKQVLVNLLNIRNQKATDVLADTKDRERGAYRCDGSCGLRHAALH